MKKIIVFSLFSFALIISANAQTQNTCNAYGKNKVACSSSNTEAKTVSKKEEGSEKKVGQQTEKKDGSPKAQTIKKYNASEFKTKRYFFKSL